MALTLAVAAETAPATASGPHAALPSVDSKQFSESPATLTNGVKGEVVRIQSASPEDYGPLLRGELGSPVLLTAQLFMPAGARGALAAVIETPGSGNLGTHHLAHAATLTSAGIAVLLIDPFYARHVRNTIADQSQVSWAASAYDVLAAVKYLRSRNEIDPERIGATGGSRGGTAVLMAETAPVSDAVLGKGHGLRAVVAGYPWCGVQFRSAHLADHAALLILQGDRDDWVSLLQCQDEAHALEVAGQDALLKVFPGARHAFDRADVPPTPIAEAVTSTIFPTIYMDDAGRYFDLRTGEVSATLSAAELTRYSIEGGFLHKGVTIGSEGNQARDFSAEMLSFFQSRLRK
jgi:dienelactone hydrolase